MARPSEGWKLRPPRDKCGSYTVRFRWNGQDVERSTGRADPEGAATEAARIYASVIASGKRPRATATRRVGQLEGAVTQWCESLEQTHDPHTVDMYAAFGRSHWVPFFGDGIHNITEDNLERYVRERLRKVLATSVKKELSGLRGFIRWAAKRGLMPLVTVPKISDRTTGTAYGKRRRVAAIELSPAEVKKLLRALPEWSSSPRVPPFPVRARFEFAYETGLRPELIDLLSVPEHYRKGGKFLNVTTSLDKGRWARRVPLSPAAQRALKRVCPKDGIVFGHHDYRTPLARAASKALPEDRAALFTGAHLRSARGTHWLDKGAPLTGVQFLLGHLRTETTAKYIRPSERAAKAALKAR